MLPQADQARKAVWSAVNPHTGMKRIDEAFPLQVRANTRVNEMK
jgi:phage terminase large subunit